MTFIILKKSLESNGKILVSDLLKKIRYLYWDKKCIIPWCTKTHNCLSSRHLCYPWILYWELCMASFTDSIIFWGMEHMGQNGQDGYIDIMYIIFKENITTDKTNNRWIKGSNLSYIPQDLMVGRQKSEQIVMLFKLNSAPWSLEVRMSMPNTRYTKQDRKIDANAIFERGLRVKVFQKYGTDHGLQWRAIETRHLLKRKDVSFIFTIFPKTFWNNWYLSWKP